MPTPQVVRIPARARAAWERMTEKIGADVIAAGFPAPMESEVLAIMIGQFDEAHGGPGVPLPRVFGFTGHEKTPLMSIDDRLERIEKALGIEGPPEPEIKVYQEGEPGADDVIGLYRDTD